MATLTKREVDQLEPRDREYFAWDDRIKGFGVRVIPSGVKTFIFRYKIGRATKRMKLGLLGSVTPEEARKLAKDAALAVANGQDPGQKKAERRKAATVAEACARFLKEYSKPRKKDNSFRNDQLIARLHVVPELGTMRLMELERKHVAGLLSAMSDRPYQANRVRAFLSKLVEWGREVGEFPEDSANPVRLVKPYKELKREAMLDVEQLGRLAEALTKAEADPVTCAAAQVIRGLVLTGARLSEIQNLRWSHVDIDRSRLVLEDSKTGPRHIILGDSAAEFFSKLDRPANGDGWVFPSPARHDTPVGEVRAVWYDIRRAAELPDGLRLHDLRHVHASLAVSSGISLYITGKLLGHKVAATTQRYSHVADEATKAAADKVSGIIAAAMAKRDPQQEAPTRGKVVSIDRGRSGRKKG